jgi:hypothetical protein
MGRNTVDAARDDFLFARDPSIHAQSPAKVPHRPLSLLILPTSQKRVWG